MAGKKSGNSPRKAVVQSKKVQSFLEQAAKTPMQGTHQELAQSAARPTGRLIFAMDATASRQPSWDRACHLQAGMFEAAASVGRLSVQLCYYRGFSDFFASPWLGDARQLVSLMNTVYCQGGYTQLHRVLDQALQETRRERVNAVIVVSDALEEDLKRLYGQAGKLGVLQTPLFMFQEGNDPQVARAYQQLASLSGGVYSHFDEGSSGQLRDLLRAVAVFASGGKGSLRQFLSTLDKPAALPLAEFKKLC